MPTSTAGPSSERARPRDRSSGFTLLELCVVLLILGIAVSFVAPRLRDPDTLALTSTAARLATTARYLYDEAAYQRLPMRLNFDLDHQTYFVTVLGGDPDAPEFVPVDTLLARPQSLPDAVAFADVVLPALGTVTEGTVFAQFSPDGWSDPLVVHLRGRAGGDGADAGRRPLRDARRRPRWPARGRSPSRRGVGCERHLRVGLERRVRVTLERNVGVEHAAVEVRWRALMRRAASRSSRCWSRWRCSASRS
jgi:prepilin-type N-terminal cleavage/methylation domain-containing protein